MEGRISSAIRVKPGDPIIGRLCCMIAIREQLVHAASDGTQLFDGYTLACSEDHTATLENGQWREA